jgi:cyclic pyranopterin phosphate synthase
VSESGLTHLDAGGAANMVDVGDKVHSTREAVARGTVTMARETFDAIMAGNAKKGDVIGIARIAGIMAAKKTSDLIPLCHPLALSKVGVDIQPDPALPGFVVTATARVTGQTGVEMEALTAVSVACLTIYDMAKALDKAMIIGSIGLVRKSGGKSGPWSSSDTP